MLKVARQNLLGELRGVLDDEPVALGVPADDVAVFLSLSEKEGTCRIS